MRLKNLDWKDVAIGLLFITAIIIAIWYFFNNFLKLGI
jgi:hypothetical protein